MSLIKRQCWALKQNNERCRNSCVRNGNLCWVHMKQSREKPAMFNFVPEFHKKLEETKRFEKETLSKWEKSSPTVSSSRKSKSKQKLNEEFLRKEVQRLENLFHQLRMQNLDDD
eukprot:TRINITY_DN27064_c0_g2_i1.p1 TRINITY_DN27064_c0_g2~~TRINITY_DN27064_c0_g2_i1.p1  ORF type:complete len:114 (-),score=13.57 TRINITY_DN27064_c0_g2_i1:217-558(-)